MAIQSNKNSQPDKPRQNGEAKKKAAAQKSGTPVTVHSYAGYKQDQKPRAFELEGRRLTILSVKKTWLEEPEHGHRRRTFFRVHAHNGRIYDLAHDEASGEWTLEPGEKRR